MDDAQTLCREYVNWVFVGMEAGGYIADKKREEIHEQLNEIFGADIVSNTLYDLFASIDLPRTPPLHEEWTEVVDKYGKKLLAYLEKHKGKKAAELLEEVT